jgi:hypothetical protein
MQSLAGLIGAAQDDGRAPAAALASLTGVRGLAAELERSELALIEAARDSGATWSQIAAAIGASRRQTAQKRHADLSRRHLRPPEVDAPEPATAAAQGARESVTARADHIRPAPGPRGPAAPAHTASTARRNQSEDLAPTPARATGTTRRRPAAPRITAAVIGEGRYEIVKAPGHAESRAWHVLVGGKRAGLVRPTWRGERGRPGWLAVTNDGTELPVTGTSRVTTAGNARTRDAAAVSLLHALHRQQHEHDNRKNGTA